MRRESVAMPLAEKDGLNLGVIQRGDKWELFDICLEHLMEILSQQTQSV